MNTLLVGFDSAWTQNNSGALVGVRRFSDGTLKELGLPRVAGFSQAENVILRWQAQETPTATIVLIDQPTIVRNSAGQRPVENLVASPISLRRGGVQPANTGRVEMFGEVAPVRGFLRRFGGAADPFEPVASTRVFETYPVLAMIALGWTLPDSRPSGRLPKYNPKNKKKFSIDDWRHVCGRLSHEITTRHLPELSAWISSVKAKQSPRKEDQDFLDACVCLLVALYLSELKKCLMVGNMDTGYIVVPAGDDLRKELESRCNHTDRKPSVWVQSFVLKASG